MPKQTAIMAKRSLQYTPLGPFMSLSGTIFIDRGNSVSAFRSIDVAGEKMKRTKTSLWMFPEGTRHLSKEATMLPLKKGGFHLAINAGIPVTPIVCENYWHIYRKGVFESGTMKVRGKWRKHLLFR
jgi:lysophosphatidate acyltransferase